MFLAHEQTALAYQSTVPARSGVDTRREAGDEVGVAHAERGVLETEAWPACPVPGNCSDVSLDLCLAFGVRG
jgi:hypothetical protein